jgi:hypothetical protein
MMAKSRILSGAMTPECAQRRSRPKKRASAPLVGAACRWPVQVLMLCQVRTALRRSMVAQLLERALL